MGSKKKNKKAAKSRPVKRSGAGILQLDRGGFYIMQKRRVGPSGYKLVGWLFVEEEDVKEHYCLITSMVGDPYPDGGPNSDMEKAVYVVQQPWTQASSGLYNRETRFQPFVEEDDYLYADDPDNGGNAEWTSLQDFKDAVYEDIIFPFPIPPFYRSANRRIVSYT